MQLVYQLILKAYSEDPNTRIFGNCFLEVVVEALSTQDQGGRILRYYLYQCLVPYRVFHQERRMDAVHKI
jgi:hypothetical protein